MTEVDARAFLDRFEVSELAARGILNGETRLLNNRSVAPLRDLMTEHGVSRLVSDGGWLLGADGTFRNPRSDGATSGNVDDPAGTGQVFNYQNTSVNPHFTRGQATTAKDSGESTFALERDLQKALRDNIGRLEAGLRIVDGGTEQTVAAGRIDITAEAPDGALVVIELKAGRADLRAVGQVLSYMGTVSTDRDMRHPGRGFLRPARGDGDAGRARSRAPRLLLRVRLRRALRLATACAASQRCRRAPRGRLDRGGGEQCASTRRTPSSRPVHFHTSEREFYQEERLVMALSRTASWRRRFRGDRPEPPQGTPSGLGYPRAVHGRSRDDLVGREAEGHAVAQARGGPIGRR